MVSGSSARNEKITETDMKTAVLQQPCSDLFIYYISGGVRPDALLHGDTYIGNWQEDGFSFLFFSEPAGSRVRTVVEKQTGLELLDQFHMTYEQWQGGPLENFRAGNFLICPPWKDKAGEQENAIRILLDPGVVFGNGMHPTTRDCLSFLEEICLTQSPESALDMGTGTGLLALAAARLGCAKVLALDFNYLAVQTAVRNIALNGLEQQILAFQGRAEEWMNLPADLLIANIHYDVMKELVVSEGFLKKKYFILSGLFRSEAEKIQDILSALSVTITETRERDGVWHTICGKISE